MVQERALLHHGGGPGTWGSLGLWGNGAEDYACACTTLALAVGRASGMRAGDRVLSVACGAGDELLLWLQACGARQVLGVERDAALVAAARSLTAGRPAITVRSGSGSALEALGLPAASFDRVVCVDAAYHLRPRHAFLQAAWQLLRPGGGLAYTDLVWGGAAAAWKTALLRGAARACGVPADDLLPAAVQDQRLRAAGFQGVQVQHLDDAVLGGFSAFVHRQGRTLGRAAWQAAWRRPALTARLIPPCRAAGLGYVMLSATRPAATGAASMAAATA